MSSVPADRDLDDVGLVTVLVGLHPRFGLLVVLDLLPAVARAHPARFEHPFHQTAIVQEAVFLDQLRRVLAELPPTGAVTDRLRPGDVLDELDRDLEDLVFLFPREVGRVLVGVAVNAEFVAGGRDRPRSRRGRSRSCARGRTTTFGHPAPRKRASIRGMPSFPAASPLRDPQASLRLRRNPASQRRSPRLHRSLRRRYSWCGCDSTHQR